MIHLLPVKIQTFTKNAKKADPAPCTFCCPRVRFRIIQSVLGLVYVTRSAVPAATLGPQAMLFRMCLSLTFILSVVTEA